MADGVGETVGDADGVGVGDCVGVGVVPTTVTELEYAYPDSAMLFAALIL